MTEDELRDFDPCEGEGRPCKVCGQVQEPWRYSDYCQACVWDGLASLDPERRRSAEEMARERLAADQERMIEAALPDHQEGEE